MDISHFVLQPWTLGLEGACDLFHHSYIGFECIGQCCCLRSTKALLRPTLEREYRHPINHIDWAFRLRTLWTAETYHGLACRCRVLEYFAHSEDAPRPALELCERLETSAVVLVLSRRHVLL